MDDVKTGNVILKYWDLWLASYFCGVADGVMVDDGVCKVNGWIDRGRNNRSMLLFSSVRA